MKAKHQRLILAAVALCGVAGAGVLAASALRDEAAYFRTPAEVKDGKAVVGEPMRLGGMVAAGSIKRRSDGLTIDFVATDGKATIPVQFTGIVPDLFAENERLHERTPRGGTKWSPSSVKNLIDRARRSGLLADDDVAPTRS